MIASVGKGSYVEPSKTTVADWARARIDQWEGAGDISARTAARYRQLLKNQIAPHIGAKMVQKLNWQDIEALHNTLRPSVAARTIGHAHRVIGKALSDAQKAGMVVENCCKLQRAPKVTDDEMVIVRDVPGFLAKIEGSRLYPLAVLGLFCGLRLGEALALRWSNVDLDRGVIQVREALEETAAFGIRFKTPKSKAGSRDISLPDIVIEVLREHRKQVLELRMKLGAGRMSEGALVFANIEGRPLRPTTVSADWAALAKRIGMPEVTFHALRHSHASQLIDRGVDPVTISKRLGHADPSITLRVYSHLFRQDDSKAAAAINAALSGS